MKFQVEKTGVTKWDVLGMTKSIDALMGAGTTARAVFSPVAYFVAMGKVYGFRLDGKLYTVWDGSTTSAKDRFIFKLVAGGSAKVIDGVPGIDSLHVVPVPTPSMARGTSLTVHWTGRPEGKPWSEFEDFETLFKPLGFDAAKGAAP